MARLGSLTPELSRYRVAARHHRHRKRRSLGTAREVPTYLVGHSTIGIGSTLILQVVPASTAGRPLTHVDQCVRSNRIPSAGVVVATPATSNGGAALPKNGHYAKRGFIVLAVTRCSRQTILTETETTAGPREMYPVSPRGNAQSNTRKLVVAINLHPHTSLNQGLQLWQNVAATRAKGPAD